MVGHVRKLLTICLLQIGGSEFLPVESNLAKLFQIHLPHVRKPVELVWQSKSRDFLYLENFSIFF